jgi:nucleoside-diphosphate-sugar epimerase
MIPKRLINIEKAKNKLLWSPKTSLSKGIAVTVDWYKSYYEFCPPEKKHDY